MFQKGPRTNGPGKLCRHFGLTKKEDGLELWKKKSGLWVEEAPTIPKKNIIETTRIGVAYAGEAANWPLRFYIKDNPYISKK
jgi:DNA-3-methyladenine glycosylase